MIRTYIPLSAKLCHAVDGPNGTWLVTPRKHLGMDLHDVWKSDSLSRDGSPGTLAKALRLACIRAGCDPAEVCAFLDEEVAS